METGDLSLQVPKHVREARRDELVSLQQEVGQRHAESLAGREVHDLCWPSIMELLWNPQLSLPHGFKFF